MSSNRAQQVLEFGPFVFDGPGGRLLRDGRVVPLTPKAFEALALLLADAGRLVSRDTFLAALWPDTFVEEANLTSTIWMVRRALGEHDGWIETVPRRGYRFNAGVRNRVGAASPVVRPEAAPSPAAPPLASGPPVAGPWLLTGRLRPGLAAAAALFVTLGVASVAGSWLARSAAARPDPPRDVAVLPLRDLSPSGNQQALVDGFTEALITELARDPALRVSARTSSFRAGGESTRVDRIASELGVTTLVLGGVVRSGDDVRVMVQVVDGPSGHHLWGETFDGSLGDVIALQRRIARGVSGAVGAAPFAASPSPSRGVSRTAQQNYMQGREMYYRAINTNYPERGRLLQNAIDSYRDALREQPGWAEAWAGIAQASHWRAEVEPTLMFEQARTAALEAIRLNDLVAEGHGALAYVSAAYFREPRLADREFSRAIALDRETRYRHGYGMLLTELGRFDEATAMFEEARRRDPTSIQLAINAALSLASARRYEQAIAAFEALAERRPESARLGIAWARLHQHETARSLAAFSALAAAGSVAAHAGLTCALVQAARPGEARATRRALQRAAEGRPDLLVDVARAAACVGATAGALSTLEQAERLNVPWLGVVNVDEAFVNLRTHPRFQALLGRLGLSAPTP